MNSATTLITSPAIALRSIEYGLRQIAQSPDIAAMQIFPGLAHSIDHKSAILALVTRIGKRNIRPDPSIAQQIERSEVGDKNKDLLRTLYHYVTKENSLEALPKVAQKALEAQLPHIAFEISIFFFATLKAGTIQKSDPLILALDVIGQSNPFTSDGEETFQFQRALENAVSVSTSFLQSHFAQDSRLEASIRNVQAIGATLRMAGSKVTMEQPARNAYEMARNFDYNGALQRLRNDPVESNLLPIEAALSKANERDRIKVMQRALDCFSGEQITPAIKRRIVDLKIQSSERRLEELDRNLSQAADSARQEERDKLAQQLYDYKTAAFSERLANHGDNIKLRMQLSEAHRVHGNLPAAIQILQQGAANTMDAKERKAYHGMLGDLFFANEKYRVALLAYESAVGTAKPEELALQPNSFEFSMLVKIVGTLVKLGPSCFDRARELLDPAYLHSSEINREIKELYDQLT